MEKMELSSNLETVTKKVEENKRFSALQKKNINEIVTILKNEKENWGLAGSQDTTGKKQTRLYGS